MQRALILVDIQNDFCPGGALAVPEGDSIVPVVNRLMPLFPVVVATQDWHPPGHVSFASRHGKPLFATIQTAHGPQILWPDHCVQGSRGAELHPRLETGRIAQVIRKGTSGEIDSYSAFFDNARLQRTGLDAYLRERSVAELYFCGLATDYCVLFSVLDALDLGYAATVVEDGCRGVDVRPGDSEAALARIVDAGGRHISAEAVFGELGAERGA